MFGGQKDSCEMDQVMPSQASQKSHDPIIDGVYGGGVYRYRGSKHQLQAFVSLDNILHDIE